MLAPRSALVALSLVVVSCASSPATTPPHAAPAAATDTAPSPYTAAQIRDACKTGHTMVFRVESAGKPAVRRAVRFLSATDEGADTESATTDDEGRPAGAPKIAHATWEELRRHAVFPRARTTLSEESVTTPAGTFVATKYVVRDGDAVSTFYFAKTMAGPPVLFFTDQGGARVMTSTMISVSEAAPKSEANR